MVLVFVGIFNYLIDAYTIFAASVLAANTVLRSLVGAAFPLFVSYMYEGLGIHWATMIPGFLALICVPFPFLFYKYGASIRQKCKYAAESEAFLRRMKEENESSDDDDEGTKSREYSEEESAELKAERERNRGVEEAEKIEEEEAEELVSDEAQARREAEDELPKLEEIRTNRTRRSSKSGRGLQRTRTYDANPFDLDRINTKESFARIASSRTRSRGNSSASKAAK